MAIDSLADLFTEIEKEDYTTYVAIIDEINRLNLDNYELKVYLSTIPSNVVQNLTPNQCTALQIQCFKGGYQISTYGIKGPIKQAIEQAATPFRSYYNTLQVAGVTADQLKFASTYNRNQWRKANPSRRSTKGTELTFNMDMFSLSIFKNSITKRFLRTEAKNYIIKINEAFDNSNDQSADIVKIRNKFYAIVLNNTDVHTKAMLQNLLPTYLYTTDGDLYIPDEDEAICIKLSTLVTINSMASLMAYSTDTPICTHAIYTNVDTRLAERMLAAISELTNAARLTSTPAYTLLAKKLAKQLTPVDITIALKTTSSILDVHNILKENHEQYNNNNSED